MTLAGSTDVFHRSMAGLGAMAGDDLSTVLRAVRDVESAKPVLLDVLPALLDSYGSAASTLAADFFEQAREDARVPGRFAAFVPPPGDYGVEPLVNWAVGEAKTFEGFGTLVKGGMTKRIGRRGARVVVACSLDDPRCRGWMRVGRGECDFCAMLIGRGAVYTKGSVRFRSHDHCKCTAAPVWNASQETELREEFQPTQRPRTAYEQLANKERVKHWIATNL